MKAIYGGECNGDYIINTPTINPQDGIDSGMLDEIQTTEIINNDAVVDEGTRKKKIIFILFTF